LRFSEDHAGDPLAIGGPAEESASMALLIQSGLSKAAAAIACIEAGRTGIANIETT